MLSFTPFDFDYEKIKTRDYKEYNKIQNLFLEEENIQKLVRRIRIFPKNAFICPGEPIFEGIFNWDVILEGTSWCQCDCDEETYKSDSGCICELNKQFMKKYELTDEKSTLDFGDIYCNIHPLLGDDYTYILRKMKRQIELTDNYTKNKKDESIHIINPLYVLIIKDFISSTTTIHQLKRIFRSSDIVIIIVNEVFLDCKDIQKVNIMKKNSRFPEIHNQKNEFWGKHLLHK